MFSSQKGRGYRGLLLKSPHLSLFLFIFYPSTRGLRCAGRDAIAVSSWTMSSPKWHSLSCAVSGIVFCFFFVFAVKGPER